MERISCIDCRKCNRKGHPSVMRFSKYCDDHYIHKIHAKKGFFNWFTDVKDKFFEKRAKYNENEEMKDLKTKGFRPSWFWR